MEQQINPLELYSRNTVKYFKELSKENAKYYLNCVYVESSNLKLDEDPTDFCSKVIQTRINALNLPIKFSKTALFAAYSLHEGNVGKAVTILIDCLCKYKDDEITVAKLTEVYPWGFYTDATFQDYVDNYLKLKKTLWSEIY